MVNLVWKDLLILKRFLWLAALYGVFALFAFGFMKGAAISAGTIGASYMLLILACAKDDKNKSEVMLNSFPLRRRNIVLAKYLSVFLYAALAILSFLIAQRVVSVTGIPIFISQISLVGIVGALVNMIVLISFYYPIYFKLGYPRSNMFGMILFFVCFFLPTSISQIVHGLGGVGNPALVNIVAILGRLGNWQQTLADWQIASYMLVFALILMSASVCLSLRFYSRREF